MTTPEEYNKRREAWYADLLSGEYKQGRNYLHRKYKDGREERCCLGVAMIPHVEFEKREYTHQRSEDNGLVFWPVAYCKGSQLQASVLPNEVADYLGMRAEDGIFNRIAYIHQNEEKEWVFCTRKEYRQITDGSCREVASLTEANDNFVSFAEIVRYCRKHPGQVYKKGTY